ncbi:MAG: endolytic transglycosylase MltG [Trueperella sp.]|nr:endolytic transglycosylase MltG [Trueperella sp.]
MPNKILHQQSATAHEHRSNQQRRRSKLILFLAVALVVLCFTVAWPYVREIAGFTEVADYEGTGSGQVLVVIPEGSTGKDIGDILADADVVASSAAFVAAFNDDPRAQSIHAGAYQLKLKMSGKAAVAALLDPASRAELKITIPEGFTAEQIFARISDVMGIPEAEVRAAAQDTAAIGLPSEANGNIEGWLSPLTYEFSPETTATEVLKTMVQQRVQELTELGAAPEDWQHTLIMASIVEREVNWPEYYGQVARVITNRLADNGQVNGRLQMDSTVLYGVGKTGGVPTQADLKKDTPYNTYLHPGLPPTPISNPGKAAIAGVLNPADGDWLYFVTIDLSSGETRFTNSLTEHNKNVELLRDWIAKNGNN